MNNTNFLDSSGLTDEAIIALHMILLLCPEIVIKHPKILEFTSIWHDTFRDGTFH